MHGWARHSDHQEQVQAAGDGQAGLQDSILSDLPPAGDQDNQLESITAPVEEHTYVITHVENVYIQRK